MFLVSNLKFLPYYSFRHGSVLRDKLIFIGSADDLDLFYHISKFLIRWVFKKSNFPRLYDIFLDLLEFR
jgi:hypothetical protein